jgi:hypothetical protein
VAITWKKRNTVGNKREVYYRIATGGATLEVETGMKELATVEAYPLGHEDNQIRIFKNSKTASTDQDDMGSFYVDGLANADYLFRAVGR